MSHFTFPSPSSSVTAACILSVGLITAAIIDSHKSAPAPQSATATVRGTAPPITQESVAEQFRTQFLASPKAHDVRYNGIRYSVTNVTVNDVTYDSKDDTFYVGYDMDWQPKAPSDNMKSSGETLTNDGYGHYQCSVGLGVTMNPGNQVVHITLR